MSEQINGSQNQNHSYIKAVVYDLESENMNIFRGSSMFDVVRTARIKCVLLLHSLGIPCTEIDLYITLLLYGFMGVFGCELGWCEKV
jgi:hypothetical protein